MRPQTTLRSPIGKGRAPAACRAPCVCSFLADPAFIWEFFASPYVSCALLERTLLCPCCLGNSREHFVGDADCLPWSGRFGEQVWALRALGL